MSLIKYASKEQALKELNGISNSLIFDRGKKKPISLDLHLDMFQMNRQKHDGIRTMRNISIEFLSE